MSSTSYCPSSRHIDLPCVNLVSWDRPLSWLAAGLDDFRSTWPLSLSYGVIFAVLGYALVVVGMANPHLGMVLTTGFFLVAPFLALGFYDLSLRREYEVVRGESLAPFSTARRNLASIGLFALLLVFTLSVWERLSAILVGMYLGTAQVPEVSFAWLFSAANLDFLIAYAIVGALLASIVFAIGVVSLPMMLDRQVDVVTAIMTSLWVVRENLPAMLLWAGLIVILTAIGIATLFVALALVFPVLGHATWHAYRELVQR